MNKSNKQTLVKDILQVDIFMKTSFFYLNYKLLSILCKASEFEDRLNLCL